MVALVVARCCAIADPAIAVPANIEANPAVISKRIRIQEISCNPHAKAVSLETGYAAGVRG
jgi:hypothetical protein